MAKFVAEIRSISNSTCQRPRPRHADVIGNAIDGGTPIFDENFIVDQASAENCPSFASSTWRSQIRMLSLRECCHGLSDIATSIGSWRE